MKNLSLNIFTHSRNEAYAIVSQINTGITTKAHASALNEHITGATAITTTTVLLNLNDCSKTEAVIALRDTLHTFAEFHLSGCVRIYIKGINAETTILSLPINDPDETQDKITKHKLKISLEDLQ